MWYGIPFPPYPTILVEIYILLTAYAIVKHSFLDIQVIIKKTLVFAGLFASSYAVFAGFAYLGSSLFENVVQNRWIAMVPSVFVIVIILRPLEAFLRNITDKFLFQKRYDYRQLLKTFANEVLTVLDLNELLDLTATKLSEIMKLDGASVILYSKEEDELKLGMSVGEGFPETALNSNEEFIKAMRERGQYILLEKTDRKKLLSVELEKKILKPDSSPVVPLMHQENMVGMLSLGKKKSDEGFTPDDLDILLTLAKTLSIAITNARLFEELSVSQAQAAQREKMAVIGTLSAGINHEICNPLGIARGQCEVFLLNLEDGIYADKKPEELLEKAREIMKKVINETDRATVVTRKLSSFAKPAKDEIADNVHVEEEFNNVLSLVEHELKLDDIVIVNEVEKDIPCISADKKQIQEIFFNLVRNAAQSIIGSGKITFRVSSAVGQVYIDIEDTGEGISEQHVNQIFDPFFTTKDPGMGTGLGLFIVKQVVEKNGGSITVQSEVGKGTIFRLVFDAADKGEGT
jgi:signal transduction histidine kinase